MSSTPEAPAKLDAAAVPLFTVWDAAHYLRAPVWSVLAMLGRGPHDPEWILLRHRGRSPFSLPGSPDEVSDHPVFAERLSFRHFAGLYAAHFAVASLAERASDDLFPFGRRAALHEAAWRFMRPFSHTPDPFADGSTSEKVRRLIASGADVLEEADARWLEKRLLLCLDRIEQEGGMPSRLYPFSRFPAEGSPRAVVMDPRIRFGRPTLSGRGVPTDALFERHQAGDSVAELAADYDVDVSEVEEALRYEGAQRLPLFPYFGW